MLGSDKSMLVDKCRRKYIITIILLGVLIAGCYINAVDEKHVIQEIDKKMKTNQITKDLDNEMKTNQITEDVDNKMKINQIAYDIKKVALTFDDGPNGIYTEKLLEGLKERNVKATFFITGENIKENEDLILRMYEEGHLIGNHTYSHVNLSKLSFKEACEEISDTNAYIYNLTGYEVKYIRPPFGALTEELREETDMSIVMWNVDPLDWKDQNSTLIANRIIKSVKNGDIILLHDIFNSSVEAALKVIDELKCQGYVFVTVDEMGENSKVMAK